MITKAIDKISSRVNLTEDETREVMNAIMNGDASSSQIGAFLIGLKTKGETVDEILGAVKALRDNMTSVDVEFDRLIDTCGTGGDGGCTFNISTAVSIIAASAGVKVAKHGNRAISSKSGSADVLSELGIDVNLTKEESEKNIETKGMSFLFAPNYHKAMKNVAKERAELKTRTIFNIIGPLCNPAKITGQLMGVYDKALVPKIGAVLLKLGIKRALVVHGDDGLDEITTTTTTTICEVKDGSINTLTLNPKALGIELSSKEDICGDDAKVNAEIILDILKGKKGPKRDIVVLNAAAALYVGEEVDSIKEGIAKANYLLDEQVAYKKYLELSGGR